MATGYRVAGGVDFDQLFEPGGLAIWGFRRAGGGPCQFAPRSGLPPRPNTGYRQSNGLDVSDAWLPVGSAPPMPGFNGRSYAANALAPTNQTGTTSATIRLEMLSNGNWQVSRSIAGSGGGNGTTVIETGTWLPAGQSAGEYLVAFTYSGDTSQAQVGNGAPTSEWLSTTRSFGLTTSVRANSIEHNQSQITLYVHLTRNGAGTTIAFTNLASSAVGWQ